MNEIVLELTERVRKDYQAFPPQIRKKFKKQVRFLAENPRHPSLQIHSLPALTH